MNLLKFLSDSVKCFVMTITGLWVYQLLAEVVSPLPIFLLIESAVITCTIFSITVNNVVHVHSTLTEINTVQVWTKGGDKAGKYGYQMKIKKQKPSFFLLLMTIMSPSRAQWQLSNCPCLDHKVLTSLKTRRHKLCRII